MHPTENYFYRMLLQQKIDFTCLVQQTLSRNNGEILCAGTYHLVSLFLIDADTVTKGEFSIEETGIIWTLLQKLDENPEDGLYEPEQLMELIRFASGKRGLLCAEQGDRPVPGNGSQPVLRSGGYHKPDQPGDTRQSLRLACRSSRKQVIYAEISLSGSGS